MLSSSIFHQDLTVSSLESSVEFYGMVLKRLGYERADSYAEGNPCWLSFTSEYVSSIALHTMPTGLDKLTLCDQYCELRVSNRSKVDEYYEFLLSWDAVVINPPIERASESQRYSIAFQGPDRVAFEVLFEMDCRIKNYHRY